MTGIQCKGTAKNSNLNILQSFQLSKPTYYHRRTIIHEQSVST